MLCPNCSKEISGKAQTCPYCKFQIELEVANVHPNQAGTSQPPTAVPYATPMRQPVPKKKGVPAWVIILIIVGVLLIGGIISAVIIKNVLVNKVLPEVHNQIQSNIDSQIDSDLDDLASDFGFSEEDSSAETKESAKESTTATTTEPTTETTTEFKTDLDLRNVGYPKITDFYWVKNASPTRFPAGSVRLTTDKQLLGRWKAYYVYSDGVKELCNLTIAAGGSAAKVAVKPCAINYNGMQWVSEYKLRGYSYGDGELSNGIVTASGVNGTITLFSFYEYNGKQYGFAKTVIQSGETVNIALVRP